MKQVEFYQWWVPDLLTGQMRLTPQKMSVQDAQQCYPGYKPEPTSREVRLLPETPDEATALADAPCADRR